ncbi:DNA replication/repair protein RecF [Candidatus Peregrinibacteria bacterium]|nr:DNA replication/repair protein RecF [Candidatus Peregrinibacteria bacterium]
MLKSLFLQNFRNYEEFDLDFDDPVGLTYFIGDNGQGKTNILEAIYLLALSKSFRTSSVENMIKWDREFCRIRGDFDLDQKQVELECFLGKSPHPRRVLKKDQIKISAQNFVGNIQIVFFQPEDINMLYLGPDLRRKYLDIINVQIDRKYYSALRKFKRLKEQRNAILKGIKEGRTSRSDLQIWDEQFANEAAIIYLERAKTIEFLNERLSKLYQEISGGNESLKIDYKNTLNLDYSILMEATNLKEIIRMELEKALPKDLVSEHTSIGPHRDDLDFVLNEIKIASHASRGEFRSIVLACKLAEIEFYTNKGESKPLLLLDDVFSELDHQRQVFLLERVKNYQTFITTTKDSAVINQEKLAPGRFVEIVNGNLSN